MAIKSTGLRNYLLDTGSVKSALALGFIRIFAGAIPTDADAAETGTLLCVITDAADGTTGLTLETSAVSGIINKNASVWGSTSGSTGVASYFRFVQAGDTGALSSTDKRIQGTIATAGADFNMTNTTITSGLMNVDYFSIAEPE